MCGLCRVTGPGLESVLRLHLDPEGHEEAAPPDVPHSHPVPRLHHAEPDSLAVQGDLAVQGHIKGQEVTVDENGQLAVDRIDSVNNPDALWRSNCGLRLVHEGRSVDGLLSHASESNRHANQEWGRSTASVPEKSARRRLAHGQQPANRSVTWPILDRAPGPISTSRRPCGPP